MHYGCKLAIILLSIATWVSCSGPGRRSAPIEADRGALALDAASLPLDIGVTHPDRLVDFFKNSENPGSAAQDMQVVGRAFGDVYYVGGPARVCSLQPNGELFGTHAVDTGDGLVLVDPVDKDVTSAKLKAVGLSLTNVRWILLTHMHSDHTAAVNDILVDLPKVTVMASAFAASHLRSGGDGSKCMWGGDLVGNKTTVHRIVRDGEILKLGTKEIHVLWLPGHTTGSTAYYLSETAGGKTAGILFAGDALYGIWDGNIYGDYAEFHRSMDKLARFSVAHPIDLVLGGHSCFGLEPNSVDRLAVELQKRNAEQKAVYDCFAKNCPTMMPLHPSKTPCPGRDDHSSYCVLKPQCTACCDGSSPRT